MTDEEEHLLVKRLTSLAREDTVVPKKAAMTHMKGQACKVNYKRQADMHAKGRRAGGLTSLNGTHQRACRHACKGQQGRQDASLLVPEKA